MSPRPNAPKGPPRDLDEPLVPRRVVVILATVFVLAVSGWIVYDHLVVTDEERISVLVDLMHGTLTAQKADAAMAWIDPAREPLDLVALGQDFHFDAGRADEAKERIRGQLARYEGRELRLIRRTIAVEGADATVEAQVLSADGLVTVHLALTKRGEAWLVRRAQVQ